MKKLLFALFLTTLGLRAQTPPPPAGADAGGAAAPASQEELLQRRAQRRLQPGAPGAPVSPALRPGQRVPPAAGTATPASAAAAAAAGSDATIAIAPPAQPTIPPSKIVPAGMIDFRQADLNLVLQLYAEMVNRTILRPATLPAATITLRTQTDLTEKEAIQALESSLAMNGIEMIPVGDKFVKALPTPNYPAAGQLPSTARVEDLPELGSCVTYIVQLHYTKPSEMVAVLQPFASTVPSPILPIESSQMLVLRDHAENVKRMVEMINRVDINVPAEYTSEVIPIKYALASDIASALNSLSTGGGGATVGSAGGSSRGGGTRTSTTRTGTMGNTPGMPGSTMPGMGGPGGATTPMGSTGASSSFTDRLRNLISKASTSGDIQVLGQTKIIADERTNSLLVFASREDMKMIKDIVAKLDIVLAQVLIEAVVIEVSLDNSKSLGVSYLETQPHSIGSFFHGQGAINNNNMLNSGSFSSSGATNVAGNLSSGFSYLAGLGNDLDVSVTAIAADSRAKILQRPRIQTSNAKQATLFVGESRPYPNGSYYGGGAYGGYSSIQQMQIGVSLDVTPLINVEGLVVMDIHQKIDSVKGTVSIANVGDVPITSSKEAQASIAVRDRDTIILGGLIETDKSQNNSGVPVLKDIPYLGALFRSSSTDDTHSELIVLIRPTVLPTPEVAALTATREKNDMPYVRDTEREIRAEEAKSKRQSDKRWQAEERKLQQSDPAASKFTPVQ